MNENNLTAETVLEQSLELNKIQADMLKERGKSQRAPWIALILVSLIMAIVVISSFAFFSQYEFYTETTTIAQDTGEGVGNNVYQEGEQAQYHEASEVANGEANGN